MTVQSLRYELGDTDVNFPIMSDAEYTYFLTKNDNSVRRASLDAAKSIMLKLSMRTDETVDLFSIKGAAAAKNYIAALQAYVKNPELNQSLQVLQGYAGGISKADMIANDANSDNNIIIPPTQNNTGLPTLSFNI
jgi:hypothetical protein